MPDSTPDPLSGLRDDARELVYAQASLIVEQALARYGQVRPGSSRIDLKFRSGTEQFALLHSRTGGVEDLVAILNQVLPEQTELCFTVPDPTLYFAWDGYAAIALHPAGMDVTNLVEVPDEVRIFQVQPFSPYYIAESPVHKPAAIASVRKKQESPLTPLNDAWSAQHLSLARRLLASVTAEYERQAGTLPEPVSTVVSGLLAQGRANPKAYLVNVLQAAAFLGILPEVTAGFGDVEE